MINTITHAEFPHGDLGGWGAVRSAPPTDPPVSALSPPRINHVMNFISDSLEFIATSWAHKIMNGYTPVLPRRRASRPRRQLARSRSALGPRTPASRRLIRQAYKITADDDLMSSHQLQRLTAPASAWRKIRSGIVTNGLPLGRSATDRAHRCRCVWSLRFRLSER